MTEKYILKSKGLDKKMINSINEEIDNLPDDIKDRIIINYEGRGLRKSNFYKYILDNKEINILEKSLRKGCINDISLIELCKSDKIDGFNVLILPKGTLIYKSFHGYMTEEQTNKYLNTTDINAPSWFGNKYFTYAICRDLWEGLVSFIVQKDLIFIDMFDTHNIKKIIDIINTNNEYLLSMNFINDIKLKNGYKKSLESQLVYLSKIYPDWKDIWVYNNLKIPKKTYYYCKTIFRDLTPIGAIKKNHQDDIILFKYFLKDYSNIDGIFKSQIFSKLDLYGAYYHEECIIKNSSIIKKLKYNHNDPLCWVNWKIKSLENIDYRGFIFNIPFRRIAEQHTYSRNENFSLIKFYFNNKNNESLHLDRKSKYILSYNVHGFINLNNSINCETNIDKIINFIKQYSDNIDHILLQEVNFFTISLTKFRDKLKLIGYNYIFTTYNGSKKKNTFLVYISKEKPFNIKYIKGINENNILTIKDKLYKYKKYNFEEFLNDYDSNICRINRNQIMIKTNIGTIIGVHLSIGLRSFIKTKKNKNANRFVKKFNNYLRIMELQKLLEYKPDILIGDFNFTSKDKENKYLIKKNYQLYDANNNNSTPYNRVDHTYSKKKTGK